MKYLFATDYLTLFKKYNFWPLICDGDGKIFVSPIEEIYTISSGLKQE